MPPVYLNTVATAVPENDVHARFVEYGPRLLSDRRAGSLFRRMARRAQIEHRYSFLKPVIDDDKLDAEGFYRLSRFPSTQERMAFYEHHAFSLAKAALDQLDLSGTTHVILTTCTGFYAPGLDHQIVEHYNLQPDVERTVVGFMGCFAALNALKLARHIVRSTPWAKVLVVNLELCTLHLKPTTHLEEMLSFLIFSDGCAAALITADPVGLELESFSSTVLRQARELITWRVGDLGFDMHLSGHVPAAIAASLPGKLETMLNGCTRDDIKHWAVHPGGRSVLDAVRDGVGLDEEQMTPSRSVLRRFGNMSSPTIMFVLQDILRYANEPGPGCAMAFGPGLTVETLRFAA